jgi:hypothetical protein
VRSVAISVTFALESNRRDMSIGFQNRASRIDGRFTSIDVVELVEVLVNPRLTDTLDNFIHVLVKICLFVGRGECYERQLPLDFIVERLQFVEVAYLRDSASLKGLEIHELCENSC